VEDLMNVHDPSLREALGQGRTLPAEWYTDANLFKREAERIFATSWNYVGRSELPAIIRSTSADLDALKFRERREYAIQANWKVVVENFLECYHCAVSHPGFAHLIDLDKYQVVPYERCSVQRGPLKASARAPRNEYFGVEAGREGIYTYLWPNFMLNVYPNGGNASTNLILPIDEHHCLAVYEFFFSETMPEKEQRAMVDFIDQVQREDIIIVESVQRGLRSGFYKQGQLILSRENGIQHFQKLVFSALTD
jgi:carnitine monooxygenase subunit